MYWFNCPPLLKQWCDEVLTYGWAYGSKGKAFENKKLGIAVSLGAPAPEYSAKAPSVTPSPKLCALSS
ncbi:NAD(P)H-dependent oxidoreductase [Rothia dentocariosa]|uniref:NAD(P)H-dependent oxidoreductase n=1 Tax=Rothia dentocariosa TaxID=2047 RepID=UPI0021539BD1|nr:NAD(P)H-dependent oxidoreductase [Rothia dentocariosa]